MLILVLRCFWVSENQSCLMHLKSGQVRFLDTYCILSNKNNLLLPKTETSNYDDTVKLQHVRFFNTMKRYGFQIVQLPDIF